MQKNKWTIKPVDHCLQAQIASQLKISPILTNLLINRGYTDPQEIQEFLNPELANLSSPFELLNLGAAVEMILQFVADGKKIVVYGDYDVDGICASVVLCQGLKAIGAQVSYYVPDRLEEGYGINLGALRSIWEGQNSLVITVDCGISSYQEIHEAKSWGLEVIVTDHHQLPENLPDCIIVDPAMAVEMSPEWKDLCGTGVAFKLVQGVFEKYYGDQEMERLMPFLDLVALATVADIVALRGDNRILVKHGMQEIAKGKRPGLAALWKVAKNNENNPVNTTALGFSLAPRLNACGRIGDVNLGLQLLTTEDWAIAEEIAGQLDEENRNRQAIEKEIYEQALLKVEARGDNIQQGLIVVGEGWHPGVIGIVASRLVERFYTPTIILTNLNGVYKGSGRSIADFHLQQALVACGDLLESFGGHSQAAGLSVLAENLPAFRKRFGEIVAERTTKDSFIPTIMIDSEIGLNELNNEIFEEICKIQPTGISNPPPLFVCRGQTTTETRVVGNNGDHLRIKLKSNQGDIVGIGFKKADLEPIVREGSIDIAFNLDKNTFNGKTNLQLLIKDIKSYRRPDQLNFVDRLFFYEQDYLKNDPYRGIGESDKFYTKVVGVTFDQRQAHISELVEGQELQLVREPENQFDPNAIGVFNKAEQIGYLKKELAKHLAENLETNVVYRAVVVQITGGLIGQNYGVNLLIERQTPNQEDVLDQMVDQKNRLQSLDEAELDLAIQEAILGAYGYREKQKQAIMALKDGQNVLAILGTGRGKSAIFQTYGAYLALKKNAITMIVYPLRALVNDQYQALQKKLSPLGLIVMKGTGALDEEERADFFAKVHSGTIDIILTTPEFLAYHQQKFAKVKERLGLVVIDEAHHLASRRVGYKQLPATLKTIGPLQVLAVTATADGAVAEGIVKDLGIGVKVVDPHIRSNLQLVDQRKAKDKLAYLSNLISHGEKTVIYVNSRRQAVKIAKQLREKAPANLEQMICYYHGGLPSHDRQAIENAFRESELLVIVTTSAFGEGIDIPDIAHVVLYHLSFSREEYNQLAGRAGRNGELGTIHLLYNEQDRELNEMLLSGTCPTREPLGKFYLMLKKLAAAVGVIELGNQQLAELGEKEKIKGLTDTAVSHWLGIFEELGFIEREREGNKRRILVAPHPQKKDLSESMRYLEGVEELEDYQSYLPIAFGKNVAELLEAINKPIYPSAWVDENERG